MEAPTEWLAETARTRTHRNTDERIRMKRIVIIMLAAVLSGTAMAENDVSVTLSADLASAYLFRGATLNDGAVLQPAMEVGGLPITLGVWANLDIDDFDGALNEGQISEIDIYATYALPVDGLAITYYEYTYPGSGAENDREIELSYKISACPLAPTVKVFYGIDGGLDDNLYAEIEFSRDIEASDNVTLGLGATVGYTDPDEGESGFSHYIASVSVLTTLISTPPLA
jgi:uncharacterized protein (TIGR02001 family)